MKLPFSQLKSIKELDLPQILRTYHIELKQHNNEHVGLCPFHDDTNPSLHVSFRNGKWIWHCFGCHASGNVIDFVIKYEKVSFIKAYQKLEKLLIPQPKPVPSVPSKPEADPVFNKQELLNKVVEYYHTRLKENPAGAEYLKKRGITNPEIYRQYRIGFVDGTMKKTLPESGSVIEELKALGVLNEKGNEKFYNCVVVPITDEDGNVVGLYGRNTGLRQHLYLNGKHQGVFNGQAVKGSKRLYLTESIIDSLSLIQMGIMNAVPIYGTNGFTQEHTRLFRKYLVREVILCLDSDESGQKASQRLAKELNVMGIDTVNIILPEVKDLNEYLLQGRTKEDLEGLATNAKETQPSNNDINPPTEKEHDDQVLRVTEDNGQLDFSFESRQYRLRGFNINRLDQMKVNVKVSSGEAFYLDTFDLYNARSRENFITQAKRALGLENGSTGSPQAGHIHKDLTHIVEHLEELQTRHLDKTVNDDQAVTVMSREEREEALDFLKSKTLIEDILADFKQCGHVGEENNLLLGYLSSVSRKLSTPLALLVVSRSASGKTTLQDAVLSLTPPEDCQKYTRMTDQSLFYKGEDSLKHKLLAVEEEKGVQGCAYSLRNLQSAQGLSIATTIKDQETGKLRTETYKVNGPTSIMITTTYSEEIDFETYNRFIILTVDESIEQTRKILARQRLNESIEGIIEKKQREKIQRKHHNAQRLLKPLEVANPYSSRLTFIDTVLRARREQPKYLAMIKAVALLRQYQKEIKTAGTENAVFEYIEVDLKDIEITNRIANEVLGRALDELCPPARNLLQEIHRMVSDMARDNKVMTENIMFNRRDIREYTGWSDYQVRCHIKQLEELEYLYPVNGGPGKRYAYQLLWDGQGQDGNKFMIGLIDVQGLKANCEGFFENCEGKKDNREGTARALRATL